MPSLPPVAVAGMINSSQTCSVPVDSSCFAEDAPKDAPCSAQQQQQFAGSSSPPDVVLPASGTAPAPSCLAPAPQPMAQPCPWPSMHLLPPQTSAPRKTLVLDLDRTLVDTIMFQEPSATNPHFVYTDCEGIRAKVWMRPHLASFLQGARAHFEVVLFTAAGARHADAVLSYIDPSRELFEHRLYGQHTVERPEWSWVKDLSRLGRDISQTLLVDDCMLAGILQPDNLVPIRPFDQADPRQTLDTALVDMLNFLVSKVLPASDVREAISMYYNKSVRKPRKYPAPRLLPVYQHTQHQAALAALPALQQQQQQELAAAACACTCSCHATAAAFAASAAAAAAAGGSSGTGSMMGASGTDHQAHAHTGDASGPLMMAGGTYAGAVLDAATGLMMSADEVASFGNGGAPTAAPGAAYTGAEAENGHGGPSRSADFAGPMVAGAGAVVNGNLLGQAYARWADEIAGKNEEGGCPVCGCRFGTLSTAPILPCLTSGDQQQQQQQALPQQQAVLQVLLEAYSPHSAAAAAAGAAAPNAGSSDGAGGPCEDRRQHNGDAVAALAALSVAAAAVGDDSDADGGGSRTASGTLRRVSKGLLRRSSATGNLLGGPDASGGGADCAGMVPQTLVRAAAATIQRISSYGTLDGTACILQHSLSSASLCGAIALGLEETVRQPSVSGSIADGLALLHQQRDAADDADGGSGHPGQHAGGDGDHAIDQPHDQPHAADQGGDCPGPVDQSNGDQALAQQGAASDGMEDSLSSSHDHEEKDQGAGSGNGDAGKPPQPQQQQQQQEYDHHDEHPCIATLSVGLSRHIF